jgi:hypothetical protein
VPSETWTGTNGDAWPSPWVISGGAGGSADIQSNQGRMIAPTTNFEATRAEWVTQADGVLTVTMTLTNPVNVQYPAVVFRGDAWNTSTGGDPTNGYFAEYEAFAGTLRIIKVTAGSRTTLGSFSHAASNGVDVHLKVYAVESTICARIWNDGSGEPSTWGIDVVDSAHTTGFWALTQGGQGSNGVITWDSLTLEDAPQIVDVVAVSAQVASTASSAAATLPAGYTTGDLLIAQVVGRPSGTAGSNDTISLNQSWAAVPSQSVARVEIGTQDLNQQLFYKVATSGSETAPTVTVGTAYDASTTGWSVTTVALRGQDATTPFDGVSVLNDTNAAAATFTPDALTTGTAYARAVVFVASGDDNALSMTTAQGFEVLYSGASYDTTTGGDHAVAAASRHTATAGSTTLPTFTQTAVGNDAWVSQAISVRAAAATDTAPGELASGTGAGHNAAAQVTVNGSTATATGVANNATVSTSGPSTTATGVLATASGVAAAQLLDESGNPLRGEGGGFLYDEAGPVVDGTANISTGAALATATGSASNATVSISTSTSPATATGAGHDATAATTVTAVGVLATATVAASNASVSVSVSTSTATASGEAFNATAGQASTATGVLATATSEAFAAALAAATGAATGTATGAASDAATAVVVNGTTATAAGQAFDGAAGAESADTADGETATASTVANQAAAQIVVNGTTATAAVEAFDGSVSTSEPGQAGGILATATGAASNATVAVTTSSTTATAAGQAHDGTVVTARTAGGETATAAVLAYVATITITANGEVTVAAGTAHDATAGQAAAATGTLATAAGEAFDATVTTNTDATATGVLATATAQAFNGATTGLDQLAERSAHRRQLVVTGHRRP